MTTSSAPGKIILFGEHAVVYGRPAVAVPVTQVHADVEILDSSRAGIWISAPEVDLHAEVDTLPSDHPIAAVIHSLFSRFHISPLPPLDISISSTIPVASGLGSGAAVSVALTRALASHLGRAMTDEEVSALAYEIEKIHHGTPSGIDNTVVTYSKPVYFVKGKPIEMLKVGHPFTIVIGDTGIRAPTKEAVGDVRRLWVHNRSYWETIFDKVGIISFTARRAIEAGRWELLGELMNENHAFLQEMKVSSPELDRLVDAAMEAGALGAKMSGGGRGGNMIALVNVGDADSASRPVLSRRAELVEAAVEASIREAGARNTVITTIGHE